MERDSCRDFASCVDLVPIFAFLSAEEKQEIRALAAHRFYEKGGIVYSPGEAGKRLYIVHEGKIKISRYTDDGREQVIRVAGPGEFVGELSLFGSAPPADYAVAVEESSLCVIDGEHLKKLIEKHPAVGMKIIEELSKRLSVLEELIEGINLHSVEWRLARVLLSRADKNNVVVLNTTKGNFASQIGMSRETLSRKFALFREKRWIKFITPRKILITDRKALEEIL